jgi:hypothetical protein
MLTPPIYSNSLPTAPTKLAAGDESVGSAATLPRVTVTPATGHNGAVRGAAAVRGAGHCPYRIVGGAKLELGRTRGIKRNSGGHVRSPQPSTCMCGHADKSFQLDYVFLAKCAAAPVREVLVGDR